MDPPEPMPAIGDGGMLGDLDDAAIDALIEAAGPGAQSPLLMVELRHAGGAAGRAPEGHGATGALAGSYVLFGGGLPMTPEIGQAVIERLAAVKAALAPWIAGREYWNFTEREVPDASGFFAPEVYARLQHVKAAYDADDVFRGNHPIPPARG